MLKLLLIPGWIIALIFVGLLGRKLKEEDNKYDSRKNN